MKRYRLLFIIAALVSVQAFAMETEPQGQEASLEQVLARNDGDLTRALFDAAKNGYTQAVIALIEAGADVHAKDDYGDTPLHEAAMHGYAQTVIALVGYGADVHVKDNFDNTPLYRAAENGHTETVIALVGYDADVHAKSSYGDTPLHWAARYGDTETVIALIECGADVHAKGGNGYTALLWAAFNGHTETVIALVGYDGVDVHVKDSYGYTALHLAVLNGHAETVQALLLAGQGKKKTDQQVQDSRNRVITLLSLCTTPIERQEITRYFFIFKQRNKLQELPKLSSDIVKLILLQLPKDIFSEGMLGYILPIADQKQISQLVQYCPRELFVQVSKTCVAIKGNVIQKIIDNAIGQATGLCKIENNDHQTVCDFAHTDNMKELLHPNDSEGKRAAFIEEAIKQEFNQ